MPTHLRGAGAGAWVGVRTSGQPYRKDKDLRLGGPAPPPASTLHEPSPPEEAAPLLLQSAAVHVKTEEPPAWPEGAYVEEEEQPSVDAQPRIKEEEPPPAWPEGAFDQLEEMEIEEMQSDDDGVEMEEEAEEPTAEGAFGHPFE